MGTLHKNQWAPEETVPSGQVRLLSALMAQLALGRTILGRKQRKEKHPCEPWRCKQSSVLSLGLLFQPQQC